MSATDFHLTERLQFHVKGFRYSYTTLSLKTKEILFQKIRKIEILNVKLLFSAIPSLLCVCVYQL